MFQPLTDKGLLYAQTNGTGNGNPCPSFAAGPAFAAFSLFPYSAYLLPFEYAVSASPGPERKAETH